MQTFWQRFAASARSGLPLTSDVTVLQPPRGTGAHRHEHLQLVHDAVLLRERLQAHPDLRHRALVHADHAVACAGDPRPRLTPRWQTPTQTPATPQATMWCWSWISRDMVVRSSGAWRCTVSRECEACKAECVPNMRSTPSILGKLGSNKAPSKICTEHAGQSASVSDKHRSWLPSAHRRAACRRGRRGAQRWTRGPASRAASRACRPSHAACAPLPSLSPARSN